MQSEYHRLQKEHEDEAEDHKQIDEQRNVEYNQFKQEKALEVSNLKGNYYMSLTVLNLIQIALIDEQHSVELSF